MSIEFRIHGGGQIARFYDVTLKIMKNHEKSCFFMKNLENPTFFKKFFDSFWYHYTRRTKRRMPTNIDDKTEHANFQPQTQVKQTEHSTQQIDH